MTDSLHEYINEYRRRKWSVIPIVGDRNKTNPKQPAILWREYQDKPPSIHHIHQWFFGSYPYQALGIITGRGSRLAVLDIDDSRLAGRFEETLPALAHTYTVLSGNRETPHYYYTVNAATWPQTWPPSPRQNNFTNADFIYGGYVIAPPSMIDGKIWRRVNDIEPVELSPDDYQAIVDFFTANNLRAAIDKAKAARQGHSASITPAPITVDESQTYQVAASSAINAPTIDSHALIRHYQTRAGKGRNNALFDTACLARDCGYTLEQTVKTIGLHFVMSPAPFNHNPQDYDSRYREMQATIQSVFNRPPRPRTKQAARLSNAVREWLCQHGLTCAARLIEVLYTVLEPGQRFTRAMVIRIGRAAGIGRDSVIRALGAGVFGPSLDEPSPSAKTTLQNTDSVEIIYCINDGGTKSVKSLGRASLVYLLPGPDDLLNRYGLIDRGSDTIPVEAVSSVKTYRAALHVAMVNRLKRAKKGISSGFAARRLGITRRTIRRYELIHQIKRFEGLIRESLTWRNINRLLPKGIESGAGRYLQSNGKRFPALRPIANRLLAAKNPVELIQQTYSTYNEPQPQPAPAQKRPRNGPKRPKSAQNNTLAIHIHKTIPGLSLANVNRLIGQYGESAVRRVLAIVEGRESYNPPGLFVTILRSEVKS